MPDYKVRRLVLAIVDDDETKHLTVPFELVDLVAFSPGITQISRLKDHCRNAAVEKRLFFDLASIDVNFEQDSEDPMCPSKESEAGSGAYTQESVFNSSVMTASGLYHGLALLARRKAVDADRNVMPLAWEVRSAAPKEFNSRTDLRNDAVRGYALIRSLLANLDPENDKSLEVCIKREYKEANPNSEPLGGNTLLEVMEADLFGQKSSTGYIDNILDTLLPKWRRLFRAAVERRDVILHIPEMKRQKDDLERLAGSSDPKLNVIQEELLCVPIQGIEDAEVASGIRLSSIMADLVVEEGIYVANKAKSLGVNDRGVSVLGWYKDLLKIAETSRDWGREFKEVRKDFETCILACGAHEVWHLWQRCRESHHKENKRFFLYLLMRFRQWMKKESPEARTPSDSWTSKENQEEREKTLADVYGFMGTNVQTFLRPARDNRILPSSTPTQLRRGLLQALGSRGGLLVKKGVWDKWLARELLDYCKEPEEKGGLGLERDDILKRAEGLYR